MFFDDPRVSVAAAAEEVPEGEPAAVITAIVQDLSAFGQASAYLPVGDVAVVTVLDDDLPTLTIEADSPTRKFFWDAEYTLTREGDLSVPLTVNLDITQGGESEGGDPLPSGTSFATGPSAVTFAAGRSTAPLILGTTEVPTVEVRPGADVNFNMDNGWVDAALVDSETWSSLCTERMVSRPR